MATVTETSHYKQPDYGVIADIVGDLYDRMLSDPRIWYYWKGHNAERQAAESREFAELVRVSLEGPIASRDGATRTSYAPLGVSSVEWWVFVELAAATLDDGKLCDDNKANLFFALSRAKAAISSLGPGPSAPLGFAAPPQLLSQREQEVLRLVALGRNNTEIAAELFISVNTVTRHVSNIFAKTGTNNRVQAAVYAARRRIV